MTTIQFVHLQPRYSYTKPPIRGPVTGPFIGPIDHIENARARWASSEISETVPGALAIIAAPKHALKYGQLDDMADTIIYHARYTYPNNRTTRTSGKDVAKAQGITRIENTSRATA
jgi:hypothetical protein